jgi:hypothetical protein
MCIVKDNENWLSVFKSSARRDFFTLDSNGKTILGPREKKKLGHHVLGYQIIKPTGCLMPHPKQSLTLPQGL